MNRGKLACLLALLLCAALISSCSLPTASTPSPSPTQEATPSPSPSPSPTPSPTPTPTPTPTPASTPTPDPDAQFYNESGETYSIDPDKHHWTYKSPTMGITIEKIEDKKQKLVYFAADIHIRDFSLLRTGLANKKDPGTRRQPDAVARQYNAVYAQNFDLLLEDVDKKGLIIQDGKTLRNKTQKNDVMAFTPDGAVHVFYRGTVTEKKLLAMGVKDAITFGPLLVIDGKIGTIKSTIISYSPTQKEPRSGFGMIKPGHYIGIVAEGRNVDGSQGCTLPGLAQLFLARGCVTAYNLDGGQSVAMVFMGKTLNGADNSKFSGQRSVSEILRIGESGLVPAALAKYPPEASPPPSASADPT